MQKNVDIVALRLPTTGESPCEPSLPTTLLPTLPSTMLTSCGLCCMSADGQRPASQDQRSILAGDPESMSFFANQCSVVTLVASIQHKPYTAARTNQISMVKLYTQAGACQHGSKPGLQWMTSLQCRTKPIEHQQCRPVLCQTLLLPTTTSHN